MDPKPEPIPPTPYSQDTYFSQTLDFSEFELSDFFLLDDASPEVDSMDHNHHLQPPPSSSLLPTSSGSSMKCKDQECLKKPGKGECGFRVAFRTKSDLEIMDDGFKWRKYGKKMVKNSPNPRNYYRCSTRGCHVKKRVEREREDPSYVITTYEGVHNHESPCIVYYNHNGWTLHPSSSSSFPNPPY